MKRYFKDIYYEETFIEVTVEEFENDMRRYKFSDFEAIIIADNRRIGQQSVHPNDVDQVAFWNKYSNADICGSVKIRDFCDYYVVEVSDVTHH